MSTGTSTGMAGPAAGRAAWRPCTAFVLASGAALGAMQAGMVHALYERGIAPDLLIGASAGALNAAFLASRRPAGRRRARRAQNLTSATCLRRKTLALPGLIPNGLKITA